MMQLDIFKSNIEGVSDDSEVKPQLDLNLSDKIIVYEVSSSVSSSSIKNDRTMPAEINMDTLNN